MNTDQNIQGIYLARLDLGVQNHLGILSKINGQCAALENALGPVTTYFANGLMVERDGNPLVSYKANISASQRFHQYGFYNLLKKQSLQADYFYIRYQLCNPSFIFFLKSIRRDNPHAPIFVELPTYPYDLEQVGLSQKIKLLQDRITRNQMAEVVDYIVTFSQVDEIFGVPTIKTQNGIAVDHFAPVTAPQFQNLNLIGVANVSHWHGYDRVIAGLKNYYDEQRASGTEVHFNIVGDGVEIPNLEKMVRKLELDNYVHFKGSLTGEALTKELASAHLAISSLGMHRLNTDTTNLKSREYCARGIPFINSHEELDIPNDFPFTFTVANDDRPVDIFRAIEYFCGLRKSQPNYGSLMRKYAFANLSWDTKLAPIASQISFQVSRNHRLG